MLLSLPRISSLFHLQVHYLKAEVDLTGKCNTNIYRAPSSHWNTWTMEYLQVALLKQNFTGQLMYHHKTTRQEVQFHLLSHKVISFKVKMGGPNSKKYQATDNSKAFFREVTSKKDLGVERQNKLLATVLFNSKLKVHYLQPNSKIMAKL